MVDKGSRNAALGVGAVVIFALAVMLIWRAARPARPRIATSAYAYFFDLDAKKLIVGDRAMIPPIHDGKAVRAHVFSCGGCKDSSGHFIGYLEKYTDEARQIKATGVHDSTQQRLEDAGRLVAMATESGGDLRWVQWDAPAARQIRSTPINKCAGETEECLPISKDIAP